MPASLVTLSWTALQFPAYAFAGIFVGTFTVTVPPPGIETESGGPLPETNVPFELLGSGL